MEEAYQLPLPEPTQAELFPRVTPDPAIAEAPGLLDGEAREFDFHHVRLGARPRAFPIGKEPPLMARTILVQRLERVLPRIVLRGVEVAQVQQLALHRAPAVHPQALANRILDVLLAVFKPRTSLQEHRVGTIA